MSNDDLLIKGEEDFDDELPEGVVSPLTNKWFVQDTANGKSYSPFCKSKRYLKYVEGGEKELVLFIRDNPNWNSYGGYDNIFQSFNHLETDETPADLPGGFYMHRNGDYNNSERLVPITIRQDSYLSMGRVEKQIEEDFSRFLGSEDLYRNLGLLYKMGVLLYGAPGTGKTCLIRSILNEKLTGEEVVIWFEGPNFMSVDFAKKVQTTLAGRLKIFIFEELTAQTHYSDRLEKLLTFLDGEMSIDKSISFATTNFPEVLPKNVVDRPSRFDKVYEVKAPGEKERKKLLEFFIKREPTAEELTNSKDLTPAQIKEIALMHLVQGVTLLEGMAKLKERTRLVDKAFAAAKKEAGFGF